MEEVGKAGPLQCIFLTKFHPTLGPKIWCSFPEGFISEKVLNAISVYIIPKPQIQRRVITINALGYKITGYPNEIENLKYDRNALKFNLCFACKSGSRTVRYEAIVKKLSENLEDLELENGLLSDNESRNDLSDILRQILYRLNNTSHCTINIALKDQLRKSSHTITVPEYERSGARRSHVERRQTMVSQYRPDSVIPPRTIVLSDKKTERETTKKPSSTDSQGMSRRASDADTYLKSAKKSSCDKSDKRNGESFHLTDSNCDIIPTFRHRGFNKECSNVSELHLKVVDVSLEPDIVQDYQVPVVVSERGGDRRIPQCWDLTTQQIIHYIDAANHVSKIAALADVENNLVKTCIQNLVYYGVVKLLPIFQYSNVYTVTSKINKLYMDEDLKQDCVSAVSKKQFNLASFRDVFQLYCSMEHGVSVRDICIKYNPQALNIDEVKLVKFGIIHGIIRRVHQYPVFTPPINLEHSYISASLTKNNPLYKMCCGTHNYDDICSKMSLTHKELTAKIDRDPNITVICK